MVELYFLGDTQVRLKDIDITAQLGSKACALLFLLMDAEGKMLNREKIIAYLWPDSKEEAARYNLRYNLWAIKKTIGKDDNGEQFLIADNMMCRINEKFQYICDFSEVNHFDRTKDYPMKTLLRFKSFFNGDLYEGNYFKGCDELNDLILQKRIECEKLKVDVLKSIAEFFHKECNCEKELESLLEISKIEPYDEEIALHIMDAYERVGKRPEAINFYKRFSNTLATSISIVPNDALIEKYRQLQDVAKMDQSLQSSGDKGKKKDEELFKIICMEGIDFFWLSRLIVYLLKRYREILTCRLNWNEVCSIAMIQNDVWSYFSIEDACKKIVQQSSDVSDVNIMNACIKALDLAFSGKHVVIETFNAKKLDNKSKGFIDYLETYIEIKDLDIEFKFYD